MLKQHKSKDKSVKAPRVKDTVKLTSITLNAIEQYATIYSMTPDSVIWQLIEFYRMENLQLLIDRLHAKYLAGISQSERAQLSILYTLLGEIDRLSGL